LARCKHCGEPAASIRPAHAACEENFQLGERQVAMEVAGAVSAEGDIEGLPARIAMVARGARIPGTRARELVIAGWARAVERFLEASALNEDEERRLIRLEYLFDLTQADLHTSDVWQSPRADAA
jgi:hypothetical protein